MPTTIYTEIDLKNIVNSGSSFTNCADTGTPPNSVMAGSFTDPAFNLAANVSSKFNETLGQNTWIADVDHVNVADPLPSNAVILNVRIQMRASGLVTSNVSNTFPVGAPQVGKVQAQTGLGAAVIPFAADLSWAAINLGSVTVNDSHLAGVANGLLTAAATNNIGTTLLQIFFDFTTNPVGAFPLGYMTHADFLTNFAQMLFGWSNFGSASAQWDVAPPPNKSGPANGSANAALNFTADNWEMQVEWGLLSSWVMSPSTVAFPGTPVVTFTHPSPNPNEKLDSITLDNIVYTPNSPEVQIWTDLLIKINIRLRAHRPQVPQFVPIGTIVGTDFDGTVLLGILNITYADLSGIYFLDDTIHHDILYDRTNTTAVTTQNVTIPSPMFVTAFIGDPDVDVLHYNGTRMRVTGTGLLKQVFQSLDNINTEQLADLTLQTANNVNPFTLANFMDQNACLRVYMTDMDDFMNVSKILIFTKATYSGYPQ